MSNVRRIENRAPSVSKMFLDRVAASPTAEAFRYPDHDGWTSVTWRQVGDRVELIAAGLIALGINAEDRVALASSTRYEWVVAIRNDDARQLERARTILKRLDPKLIEEMWA